MALLGSARVSITHQYLDRQLGAVNAHGCERILTDKMSGANDDHPDLAALIDYARPGDAVVVASLDRLGRRLPSILSTVEDLQERGIKVHSIEEEIRRDTTTGRLMLGILATLAEYERILRHERAAAAPEAAIARGKMPGRPRALPADKVAHRADARGRRIDLHDLRRARRGRPLHPVPAAR